MKMKCEYRNCEEEFERKGMKRFCSKNHKCMERTYRVRLVARQERLIEKLKRLNDVKEVVGI